MNRRSLRLFSVMAMLLAALLGLASAPQATATPTGMDVFCESGGNQYYCELTYTSSVGAMSISWYINGSYIPAYANLYFFIRSCSTSQQYNVTAVATDSTGTAQAGYTINCRSGPWQ